MKQVHNICTLNECPYYEVEWKEGSNTWEPYDHFQDSNGTTNTALDKFEAKRDSEVTVIFLVFFKCFQQTRKNMKFSNHLKVVSRVQTFLLYFDFCCNEQNC